jgi:hypothetical protein
MTFIPDLEPCTYFDRTSIPAPQREARWVSAAFSTSLTAVGWLGTEADFPTGPIPVSVRDKLEALTDDPWQP